MSKLIDEWLKTGGKIKKLKTKKSKSSKKIKKLKTKKVNNRKEKLKAFSQELNKNMAKSELWFKCLYESHKLKLHNDFFNKPLRSSYIPDVLNKQHKYVIEIDVSIHTTQSQIEIDLKKDKFYAKCDIFVIRIIAFDVKSYITGMDKLLEHRQTKPSQEYIKFSLDYQNNNK